MEAASTTFSRRELPSLFARLPDALFGPLASENRWRYWRLLVSLYETRFGPEAEIPPDDEGYLSREITLQIEQDLERDDDWAEEEDVPKMSPLNVRANGVLRRLVRAGWLRESPVGVRRYISMRPPVQRFLEMLVTFAEKGPDFIGGKVQVIFHALRQIAERPAENAATFHEVAGQARALVSTLASTSVRVRDIMDELGERDSPRAYAAGFFEEFVRKVFIGDLPDLRAANHPLQRRHEIVGLVYKIRESDALRGPLVAWYAAGLKLDAIAAAEAFERDVSKMLVFERIEDYLVRLDATVARAQRQGHSYLRYAALTRGDFERNLALAVRGALQLGAQFGALHVPLAPGPLLSAASLRAPRSAVAADHRSRLRVRAMTPEQMAVIRLQIAAEMARQVNSATMRAFLLAQGFDPKAGLIASDMKLLTVSDVAQYLALLGGAVRGHLQPAQRRSSDPVGRALPGLQLDYLGADEVTTSLLRSRSFAVRPVRRVRGADHG